MMTARLVAVAIALALLAPPDDEPPPPRRPQCRRACATRFARVEPVVRVPTPLPGTATELPVDLPRD